MSLKFNPITRKFDLIGFTRFLNNIWLTGLSATNTVLNIFRVNTSNEVEVGVPLNVGTIELPTDGGVISIVNEPVSASSPVMTTHGYSWNIDQQLVAGVRAESDGAGGITNPRFEYSGIFGSIKTVDNSTAVALSSSATYSLLNQYTKNGEYKNITPSYSTGRITVKYAGYYGVFIRGSVLSSGTAVVDYAIYVNGVITDFKGNRTVSSGATIEFGASDMLNLNVGDYVEVKVRQQSGSSINVTVTNGSLMLLYQSKQ